MNGVASFLHRDALSSVRAVSGAGGGVSEAAVYRPYGEQQEWVLDASAAGEDKGFIGERYDADAGLQYLNARYYDPRLGLFLQPDWFEVTEPGVGRNRFSYSFNDPVNLSDPEGNRARPGPLERAVDLGVRAIGDALRGLAERFRNGGPASHRLSRAIEQAAPGGVSFNNAIRSVRAGDYGLAAAYALGSVAEAATVGLGGNATTQATRSIRSIPTAMMRAPRARNATEYARVLQDVPPLPVSVPYRRPNNATTNAQRESVQGQPCWECGSTTTRQVADHIESLLNEYYRTGTNDMVRARSLQAVRAHCPTCSARQGADLAQLSREIKEYLRRR